MKISLVKSQGVEVLTGSGEITTHDLQILQAGIVKLLQSGKNRIVLELPEASSIPPEILVELAKFDLLARELSGRIILAGVTPELRAQIGRHAEPPVIECFSTLPEALLYFKPELAIDESALEPKSKAAASPASPPEAAAPPVPDPAAAQAELQQFKAEIRQKELDGLTELRKKIVELENENKLLQDRLIASLTERRAFPPKEAAQAARLKALEDRLEELVKASSVKPAPAK